MKISENRLFPYPVLRNGNDNFISSEFSAKAEYRHNEIEYEFDMDVALNEKNLIKLFENGEVSILCHLECSKTKFRSVEKLKIGKNNFKIGIESLDGRLELIVFIVAKIDLEEYSSMNFHPDYQNNSFSVQEGNILGIADVPAVYIENKKENLSHLPSIFDISYTEEYNIMKLKLDGDRIIIFLPLEEYKIRNSHKDSLHSRNIMNNMIVFPALVGILNELAHKDSIDLFGNQRWFGVIKKKLMKLGYDLEENVLEDESIFSIAQELLGELFSEGMDSLRYLEESEE